MDEKTKARICLAIEHQIFDVHVRKLVDVAATIAKIDYQQEAADKFKKRLLVLDNLEQLLKKEVSEI